MRILGCLLLLGSPTWAEPSFNEIFAVLQTREKATTAYAMVYSRWDDGVRNGPHFFAWCAGRSLYRGPRRARAVGGLLAWLTGAVIERELLHYEDGKVCFWLERQTAPVKSIWEGERYDSTGPDHRPEIGLHWRNGSLSAYLRKGRARIVGRENIGGRPCVKLLLPTASPDIFWLSEEDEYFPLQAIEYVARPEGWSAESTEDVTINDVHYLPTHTYRWERLERRGSIVYPLRARVVRIYEQPKEVVIEVISARFGAEITAEDFELPDFFLASGMAHTPLGPTSYLLAIGCASIPIIGPLLLLYRRRRRRRA